MTSPKAILPRPTVDSEAFWAACNRRELLLRRCRVCEAVHYYPRQACPQCGSDALDWLRSAGTGTIYSFTRVHVSFYGAEWESELPYVVILVDLDEGPRMLSRLLGPGERVRVGARVRVSWVEVDGQTLPFFTLADGDPGPALPGGEAEKLP